MGLYSSVEEHVYSIQEVSFNSWHLYEGLGKDLYLKLWTAAASQHGLRVLNIVPMGTHAPAWWHIPVQLLLLPPSSAHVFNRHVKRSMESREVWKAGHLPLLLFFLLKWSQHQSGYGSEAMLRLCRVARWEVWEGG